MDAFETMAFASRTSCRLRRD